MLQGGTAGQILREQGPTLQLKALGGTGSLGTPSLGSSDAIRRGATAVQGELVAAALCLCLLQFTRRSPKRLTQRRVPICFHIPEDKDMNKLCLRATVLPSWTQKQVTGAAQAVTCALR